MRNYAQRQQAAHDHDRWVRGEIERGLQETADPSMMFIANEDVEANWERKRAALLGRIPSRIE